MPCLLRFFGAHVGQDLLVANDIPMSLFCIDARHISIGDGVIINHGADVIPHSIDRGLIGHPSMRCGLCLAQPSKLHSDTKGLAASRPFVIFGSEKPCTFCINALLRAATVRSEGSFAIACMLVSASANDQPGGLHCLCCMHRLSDKGVEGVRHEVQKGYLVREHAGSLSSAAATYTNCSESLFMSE